MVRDENEKLGMFRDALNLPANGRIHILETATYSINVWGKAPVLLYVNDDCHEVSIHTSYETEWGSSFVGAQLYMHLKFGDTLRWDDKLTINLTKVGE